MVHTAPQLNPSRAPLGVAVSAGTPREPHEQLRDAQLVAAFRRALSRRGAGPLRVFHLEYPGALTCPECFEEAVRSLGGDLTPLRPEPDELGLFERYEDLYVRYERVEARQDWRDYDDDEPRPSEGLDARFHDADGYGLVRVGFPEATVWIWTYSLTSDYAEACLAARSTRELRPLLRSVKRLHRDHLREQTCLTQIGGKRSRPGTLAPLGWDDVILPPALRAELRQTVDGFFTARELYRKHAVPHRRGLLLAGPPGNGKTSILRAIGSSANVPVVVTVVDEGGSNLARAFETAADLAPAILCLEDLDSLVGQGQGRTQFLNLLDGLQPLEGVLVIATTNHPECIDPAITKRPSRFDRVFVIPEPELAQREAYLARELAGDAPAGAVEHYAEETDGYSIAFLKELVLQARLAAVRRGDTRLSEADLETGLTLTREHLNLSGLQNRGELGFKAGPRSSGQRSS